MKRAVLMVVDGLRADMVTPDLTPALWRLASTSRHFTGHRSAFPTATRVNSASIATGCLPAAHGLAGNAIALDEGSGLTAVSVGGPDFRERWRRATGRTLHRPTMAERLAGHGGAVIYSNSSAGAAHMQDPDGNGWLYHRSGSHGPGFEPLVDPGGGNVLDVGYDAAGDAHTTDVFCHALEQDRERPLFVLWVCEPDHSQHALELGSDEHRAVLRQADGCVARVAQCIEALRSRGEDVLFVVGSDHGHETVDEVVPVSELLVDAGLKESADSGDVVVASSGMSALVYLAENARERALPIERWLAARPWCEAVFAGAALEKVGQGASGGLAMAFAMAKRDIANRHGVVGLGHVVGDPFSPGDTPGFGQHGGLGPYESNPVLIVDGDGFTPGLSDAPTRTVDVAPTLLEHLGVPRSVQAGMDGRAVPRRP